MTDVPPPGETSPNPPDASSADGRAVDAEAPAQHIVAVAFDKATRADQVLLAMFHLVQEGMIDLADAAIVVKDDNGRVRLRQTVDLSPERGGLAGGWWGLLLGALVAGPVGMVVGGVAGAAGGAAYAKLRDTGLNDEWMTQAGDLMAPNSSTLFLLINSMVLPIVLEELGRYEGRILYTDFPPETRRMLEDALKER